MVDSTKISDAATKPTKHKQTNLSPTNQFFPKKKFLISYILKKTRTRWDSKPTTQGSKATALTLGQVGKSLEVAWVHYTDETALRKHMRENDQKAALSNAKRKNEIKPRISKNSAMCRIRICDQEILSLTHYPLSHTSLKNDKH